MPINLYSSIALVNNPFWGVTQGPPLSSSSVYIHTEGHHCQSDPNITSYDSLTRIASQLISLTCMYGNPAYNRILPCFIIIFLFFSFSPSSLFCGNHFLCVCGRRKLAQQSPHSLYKNIFFFCAVGTNHTVVSSSAMDLLGSQKVTCVRERWVAFFFTIRPFIPDKRTCFAIPRILIQVIPFFLFLLEK